MVYSNVHSGPSGKKTMWCTGWRPFLSPALHKVQSGTQRTGGHLRVEKATGDLNTRRGAGESKGPPAAVTLDDRPFLRAGGALYRLWHPSRCLPSPWVVHVAAPSCFAGLGRRLAHTQTCLPDETPRPPVRFLTHNGTVRGCAFAHCPHSTCLSWLVVVVHRISKKTFVFPEELSWCSRSRKCSKSDIVAYRHCCGRKV